MMVVHLVPVDWENVWWKKKKEFLFKSWGSHRTSIEVTRSEIGLLKAKLPFKKLILL